MSRDLFVFHNNLLYFLIKKIKLKIDLTQYQLIGSFTKYPLLSKLFYFCNMTLINL